MFLSSCYFYNCPSNFRIVIVKTRFPPPFPECQFLSENTNFSYDKIYLNTN